MQRLPPELAALRPDQLFAQSYMGLVKGLQPQPYFHKIDKWVDIEPAVRFGI